jgi:hypothetical protein
MRWLLLGFLTLSSASLLDLAQEEWSYLQDTCDYKGTPLRDIAIRIDWDFQLKPGILAWARYTRVYRNNLWVPSVLTETRPDVDVEIGVSPRYQWDWGCEQDGRALRTTLLHELLHATGISSSITATSVGYGPYCTLTLMDHHMHLQDGSKALQECHLPAGNIYVGGVKLYMGREFRAGVSLNHHDGIGVIGTSPPYQCQELGLNEVKMLESMGFNCVHAFLGSGATRSPSWRF